MNERFAAQLRHWKRRRTRLGDAAIGRIGESYADQGDRISRHLGNKLEDRFFEHALDFGCGWGRFTELLSHHCGHLWAADLFRDWVDRATGMIPTTTAVLMRSQQLSIDAGSMDLVVDIMTLQSIDSDSLAREATHELKRVARAGATVMSLHIVRPRAPTRTPANRASHLGLSNWRNFDLTDVDTAGDTYSLVVGTRI